jgi:formylglycine-generating enzyme required for sulfatase activity
MAGASWKLRTRQVVFLAILAVASACSCRREAEPARPSQTPQPAKAGTPWPQWNERETIAEYARRAHLEPTVVLNLGNDVKLDLVLIPAGTFMMGSPESEKGRRIDRPRHGPGPIDVETLHKVTLTRPFYIGKYEVAQKQYRQVIADRPVRDSDGNLPVSGVNWDEAQKFCQAVAKHTGMIVRLPTEAEWEFACRAGTRTRFCSGDAADDLRKVGWASYDGSFGSAKGFKPAGSFRPNAWGLHDMHGNAEEWCQARQGSYPADAATDPRGPEEGRCRIVRGGSSSAPPENCRSAYRDWGPPSYTDYAAAGIRVVVEVAGARGSRLGQGW